MATYKLSDREKFRLFEGHEATRLKTAEDGVARTEQRLSAAKAELGKAEADFDDVVADIAESKTGSRDTSKASLVRDEKTGAPTDLVIG